jgi:hypothetical protein
MSTAGVGAALRARRGLALLGAAAALAFGAVSCASEDSPDESGSSTSVGSIGTTGTGSTSLPTGTSESGGTMSTTGSGSTGSGSTSGNTTIRLDFPDPTGVTTGGCVPGESGCTDKIDLLFVIDNSGSMGEEQANLARNFPFLVDKLENLTDSVGNPVNPDVQIMFTTTDFGNSECTRFYKTNTCNPADAGCDDVMGVPTRVPERGEPIQTNCNTRLPRFTNLTGDLNFDSACTDVCSDTSLAPTDPFIQFGPDGDNVPDVPDADVNGDGVPDSPVAQTMSCIGPQGVEGCGYESPLEAMLQALNPGKCWNNPDAAGCDTDPRWTKPFLRDDALLAIVIVTDEADCTVKDPTVMTDTAFMEINPANGQPRASSAICWNAGVQCTPNGDGTYSNCVSTTNDKLQPVSRYTSYLVDVLREQGNKEVVMLGILGVPLVTQRNPMAPFEPTDGGVFDLVYRDWIAGNYPAGDLLPVDQAAGKDTTDKAFEFGIGPGCTGEDGMGGFTGQAIPPVRVKEVCESLNIDNGDGTTDIRCCIESICDTDFSNAINCLTGIISETIKPAG